jgi:hypothetical protein
MDVDGSPAMTVIPGYLEDYKVKCLPASAFYIADFLTREEEQFLLEKVIFSHSTQR